MADGFSAIVVPRSTSEFHQMINEVRGHHRAMHGQMADVAAALKTILPDVIRQRGGARQGFGGVDAKMKANRVVKPLTEIAALNDVIARLSVMSYTRYVDLVVNASKPRANSFNVEG